MDEPHHILTINKNDWGHKMKKILVVDDEQDIVELVKNRLEANNYAVIFASDGKEGIKKAQQQKPDLIIMDVIMPHMPGGDAVRLLRADAATKHIPIIFLTAVTAHTPQEAEALSVNVDGKFFKAIAKPFKAEVLLKKVKELLGDKMKEILIVDDDPDIVELVKNRLEADNYKVISASGGEEGLQNINKEKPDLIILDIGMPKIDGYTFIRALKSNDDFKSIPVIILTARGQMQGLFKVEGVKDYMTKPFKPEELLERIKKLLN